jgi:hypothetical protein
MQEAASFVLGWGWRMVRGGLTCVTPHLRCPQIPLAPPSSATTPFPTGQQRLADFFRAFPVGRMDD